MSDEKKKLSNLNDDAIDGEKIKGGFGFSGYTSEALDSNSALPSDPNPEMETNLGVEFMPGDSTGGPINTGPAEGNLPMDPGLIGPNQPNKNKI